MRHIDGLRAMHGGTPASGSLWRLFPWAIGAAMGLVVAVNAGMIYAAVHSFPGSAGSDGFDLSNRYDRVIERAQQQARLGWSIQAAVDAGHRPVLQMRDHTGAPLIGATVHATAERPLGPSHSAAMAFHETAPGHYLADGSLDEPGQWKLQVTASARQHEVRATHRILVQ
jgi:nitrogen fixation protein FixH